MQQPCKQIIKQCQHADIVEETLVQLRAGKPPLSVRLDTTLAALHNHSMHWLVSAYKAINKPELIKKVHIVLCQMSVILTCIAGFLIVQGGRF